MFRGLDGNATMQCVDSVVVLLRDDYDKTEEISETPGLSIVCKLSARASMAHAQTIVQSKMTTVKLFQFF